MGSVPEFYSPALILTSTTGGTDFQFPYIPRKCAAALRARTNTAIVCSILPINSLSSSETLRFARLNSFSIRGKLSIILTSSEILLCPTCACCSTCCKTNTNPYKSDLSSSVTSNSPLNNTLRLSLTLPNAWRYSVLACRNHFAYSSKVTASPRIIERRFEISVWRCICSVAVCSSGVKILKRFPTSPMMEERISTPFSNSAWKSSKPRSSCPATFS